MFSLICSIIPEVLVLRLADTQQQPLPFASRQPTAAASAAAVSTANIQLLAPPSASLLHTVANMEVEQQFLGEGHDIVT
jgi:hypothetical protein